MNGGGWGNGGNNMGWGGGGGGGPNGMMWGGNGGGNCNGGKMRIRLM